MLDDYLDFNAFVLTLGPGVVFSSIPCLYFLKHYFEDHVSAAINMRYEGAIWSASMMSLLTKQKIAHAKLCCGAGRRGTCDVFLMAPLCSALKSALIAP